ncbi:MAG: protein translocase subunit SecD, partial [Anaerolineales bacterium]|nr:protein translocase subunit SecD [Anaerolineales bacterium]
SPDQAYALIGTTIETDFAVSEETQPDVGDAPSQSSQIFPTVMTGSALGNVGVTTSPTGEYQVAFELKSEDAQTFADYTIRNVNSVLAIVLDKQIISAPRINEPITDGQGVISGNFTLESANSLAIQLRYGSLPIPLVVVETRTVGPTLGLDSLSKSLVAGLIGFSVVILFMILYYRLPGIVADIAIIMYAVIALALFRFIPITLSLAGIAGFLLSTGSALDANILFFERLKEELRSGRTLHQALDLGWKRAWPSIRDSNIAILITCAILFWFGSSFGATIVKGFSLTLALGVVVSLFVALIVTRTLLGLIVEYLKPTNYVKWFGI